MDAIVFPAVSVKRRAFELSVPSVTLNRGEILGIFGKSGAGKTTYMRNLREHFPSERVLYMSQFDCLLEESTIRQNIELGLACSALPPEKVSDWETRHADLLKAFEVDRHLHKYPRMMSGGQRKRAEIVRCLMMEPEILLLDEPFQGIGHLFEAVSTKYLLGRAATGGGVTIIVSHDFELLSKFSDRIMLVDDKGVIETAPSRDPSWRPQSIRSAWTLGVENVLPAAVARTLGANTPGEGFIAFWGRSSTWEYAEADLQLKIPRDRIAARRSYLIHGEAYTLVELKNELDEEPVHLIGRGTPKEGDAVLAVSEHWGVTA